MTKQRKLIYQIVKDSMSHLSAKEIFFRAKQVMPSISMGTVYRNLGLMVEDKELRKIPFKGKSDLFDATMYDHEHAVCVECGKVVDIFIDDLKEKIKNSLDGDLQDYNLTINYICSDCLKKKQN
jgi:Fe2+ or Zn2+ uptake regulation protein